MDATYIEYYARDVYGKRLYYLNDTSESIYWRKLTNKKTITGDDMGNLTKLTGVTFVQVFPPLETLTFKEA